MRIPGGDLMPVRGRRYGGTYGRRRRRNRRVILGLLLVGLGVGGAYYLRAEDEPAARVTAPQPTCTPAPTPKATVAPTRPVALPPPTAVTLTVLNGTDRSLLAKRVADQLAALGFRITTQGNAPKAVTGASQVVYGPGASSQARTASAWVRGSVVVPAPRARRGSVSVVLGSGFTRLATPAEAAAATRVAPAPAGSATPPSGVLPCRS